MILINRDFEIFFLPDCSLSVTEFHNCRQNLFYCLWWGFFPSVLQLRKCLPSLEINLGSWPLCCKISYNTAVSIGQLIDSDIFPPACISSLGLWPIMSAQALCAAWSVSKVPAIFFLWPYTDFSPVVKDVALLCLTVNWSSIIFSGWMFSSLNLSYWL